MSPSFMYAGPALTLDLIFMVFLLLAG